MEQVKMFSGYFEVDEFEKKINKWLEQHSTIQITRVTESATDVGQRVHISIFYRTSDKK